MNLLPRDAGWIEVICGPMFSGKTEELIRRLRRASYARQRMEIFKPRIDKRYSQIEIVSHSRQKLVAHAVDSAAEIDKAVGDDVKVVGIDEAQFFGGDLLAVAQSLALRGARVIVAGLDQDFRGDPFEPMPQLMAVAEVVTKELAICTVCGNPAGRSQRLLPPHINCPAGASANAEEQVVVGAADLYEARCRRCHSPEPASKAPPQPDLFSAPQNNPAPQQ